MQLIEKKRWVFLGVPFTFTKYEITENMVTITEGFFKRSENPCYMYKITDVELKSTLMERIFKLGTVVCYTGDTTHGVLELKHVKHAKEIHTAILEHSEEQRIKRKTVNMQNISGDDIDFL